MADEGLDWLLSLDVDQAEALSFLKTLDKINDGLRKLSGETEKSEGASHKAAKGHKKHKEEADTLTGALKNLLHKGLEPFIKKAESVAEFEFLRRGVDALIDAPMEAFEKLKEIGEEMLSVAAKAERTNRSFGLLLGAAEGSEVLEYIEGIAKYTEFTDDSLKSAAQSLAKVGFAGKDLTRALAASIDIAAFSPNKEEGMGEALASLERIKRTGRVDNRVLGGLGLGEKDFLKELSARTGQGAATLKKQLEKGKIDTEVALETLYTMIGKKTGKSLGGAGVEMGKTLSAQLTHLKDLPDQYYQELAKSPGLNTFKDSIGKLLEGLDPESPNGRRIFGALEGMFEGIGDSIKTFDLAGVITLGIEALEEFSIDFFKLIGSIPGTGDVGVRALVQANAIETKRDKRLKKQQQESLDRNEQVLAAQRHGTTPEFESYAIAAKKAENEDRKARAAFLSRDQSPIGSVVAKRKTLVDYMDTGFSFGWKSVGEKAGADLVAGVMSPGGIDAHSPSKKFRKLGEWSADGFDDGFDSDILNDNFRSAKPPRAGGSINVGGVSVSVSVAGGASATAAEIGEATARAVESMLPGALESALATIALQGGTA
ncbi:MAG: hypothetical protein EPN98_21495 [Phenylobacterium sp.]|uniref:hypothetical protein n=1 Tax=Phenylobacterium sp. TaxID=1871053 RepID=UPI0012020AF7|nr:hypothetical protein [Phenylobacterium sp.]TAL29020.1 MAG: hypothetical protein EPN98_21495 [Phenylobacterium sp.]